MSLDFFLQTMEYCVIIIINVGTKSTKSIVINIIVHFFFIYKYIYIYIYIYIYNIYRIVCDRVNH